MPEVELVDARIHSLAAMARALGGSQRLLPMLEIAAEEALRALGAASVSVSRVEPGTGTLRTVINTGQLGPDEVRWPQDELYQLSDFAKLRSVVGDLRTWTTSAADPAADPEEVALLRSLDKASSMASPIVVDGGLWGELYATRSILEPEFASADTAYLEALSAILAGAVSRALHVEALERLAYLDPLTGLANRRALDEAATTAFRRLPDGNRRVVTVVALDVNGLKSVNDTEGHSEGDLLLTAVARTLASTSAPSTAASWPGSAATSSACWCPTTPWRPSSQRLTPPAQPYVLCPGAPASPAASRPRSATPGDARRTSSGLPTGRSTPPRRSATRTPSSRTPPPADAPSSAPHPQTGAVCSRHARVLSIAHRFATRDPALGPSPAARRRSVVTTSTEHGRTGGSYGVATVLLVGAAVAVSLGVYGKVHDPALRPVTTLGFSGMLQMKTWLTTAAVVLLIVQLVTALWMWGRLPGAGTAPAWTSQLHRWSGSVAFVLTLPVAFHCLWSLGFATTDTRVVRARPCGVRLLRCVRREDARPEDARPARLGVARPRRERAHVAGAALAHRRPVVLHAFRSAAHLKEVPVSHDGAADEGLSRRSVLNGCGLCVVGGVIGFAVANNSDAAKPKDPHAQANAYGTTPDSGDKPLATVDQVPAGGGLILKDAKVVLTKGHRRDRPRLLGHLPAPGLPGGLGRGRRDRLPLSRQHVRPRHRRPGVRTGDEWTDRSDDHRAGQRDPRELIDVNLVRKLPTWLWLLAAGFAIGALIALS